MTRGQQLSLMIAKKLEDMELTESQRADLQLGGGTYEPIDFNKALHEVSKMLQVNDTKGLISLYKKLPKVQITSNIRIRTKSGKTMPYDQWLALVPSKFPDIPNGLQVVKVIGGNSKPYSDMTWEEYCSTMMGRLKTDSHGIVVQCTPKVIEMILVDLCRLGVIEQDERYSIEWLEDNITPEVLSKYLPTSGRVRVECLKELSKIIMKETR